MSPLLVLSPGAVYRCEAYGARVRAVVLAAVLMVLVAIAVGIAFRAEQRAAAEAVRADRAQYMAERAQRREARTWLEGYYAAMAKVADNAERGR